jgi:shikimate kinase
MIIFLVGFMGCGKSFAGKTLSDLLDIPFIDMDKAIEEQEGKTVKEIFETQGEAYFREQERSFLEQLDTDQKLIVATGGGAACFFDNMDLMNEKGWTFWLNRSKEIALSQLLKGIEKRPLLMGKSPAEVEAFYTERLAERIPFYEKATFHVGDASAEDIADMIKEIFVLPPRSTNS